MVVARSDPLGYSWATVERGYDRQQYREKGMSVTIGQNEAFSRVLVDKALEASGWNLLDPRQIQFGACQEKRGNPMGIVSPGRHSPTAAPIRREHTESGP